MFISPYPLLGIPFSDAFCGWTREARGHKLGIASCSYCFLGAQAWITDLNIGVGLKSMGAKARTPDYKLRKRDNLSS